MYQYAPAECHSGDHLYKDLMEQAREALLARPSTFFFFSFSSSKPCFMVVHIC
jgi:hypothetical protein